MAKEIERKFLIDIDKLGKLSNGNRIKQAYIETKDKTAVRVRTCGKNAWLTIKGANEGISRSEFEYDIPLKDAEQMINELCSSSIDKTRYLVEHGQHTWEIDIFHGDNEGLIVAEVELEDESEALAMPDWIDSEVSGDAKYYNSSLIGSPYRSW